MHVLPDHLRDKLKEPMGRLFSESELLDFLKENKRFVTIGDLVTYTVLKNGFYPIFCIVDYKTKRKDSPKKVKDMIRSFGDKCVKIKNPQGVIVDELWDAIEDAFQSLDDVSLRIEIDGEEDLASLAAIYMAPEDVKIIYGLPNRGVLVVTANQENKIKVKEILDQM